MTNRVTWPKALPLNNFLKYLIVFLITFPIFGQGYYNDYSPYKYTFKSAFEQYNNGNYKKAEIILAKISPIEKEYYNEEIALLSMRVKYRLNDYLASKEIGRSLL
ncbi:MAG: hypothetical protein GWP19_06425, partial [Planctomycetia bacterium]|nr:hypothetical protein [Planctomycetia bacterium]